MSWGEEDSVGRKKSKASLRYDEYSVDDDK